MRHGDWMQTASGRQFWPLDPQPEEVYIEDIAHALSMLCRFGGHCTRFYSVAEHSCHIADHAPPEHKLWALLHDASEAYIADVIRPIKPYLEGYKGIEARVMEAICLRFDLPLIQPEIVTSLDRRILGNEAEQVMSPPPMPWYFIGAPLACLTLPCWTPVEAKQQFLDRFSTFI